MHEAAAMAGCRSGVPLPGVSGRIIPQSLRGANVAGWNRFLIVLAMIALGCATHRAIAAGDPAAGARAFGQCMACHSVEPGRHLTGPSLAHAWGRKAASAEGFMRYSDALARSGLTWNAQTLDKWLAKPEALVPGTSMTFQGIKEPRVRADVIAYLQAVSEGKAPAAQGAGGMGGMMAGSEPLNLKGAGPDSVVASLHHCKDTYIVRTADGKVHKVWEYNVRLKTDSSKQGPDRGKPVVAGSGMRGDRISIIFTSPKELGEFIRESCE
jgi:cytochrome c